MPIRSLLDVKKKHFASESCKQLTRIIVRDVRALLVAQRQR
jgi:hypothetical protein